MADMNKLLGQLLGSGAAGGFAGGLAGGLTSSMLTSKSGRKALFCRDPDGNAIEFIQK